MNDIKQTFGECRQCKGTFSGRQIQKHLKTCKKYMESRGSEDVFLVKADGGIFWVYFEIPESAKLESLDKFLRDVWMECCGHMSIFKIDGITYSSFIDGRPEPGEKEMKAKLNAILKEGLKFPYEYDMGTTTEIGLTCLLKKQGKGIKIIARNSMPDFTCEECGKKATEVCSSCLGDGGCILCKACGKGHECGEETLLPIANSPRSGSCGFTGECRLIDG